MAPLVLPQTKDQDVQQRSIIAHNNEIFTHFFYSSIDNADSDIFLAKHIPFQTGRQRRKRGRSSVA